jgi:hypothetical protein
MYNRVRILHVEYVRDAIDTFADLGYQRFFCLIRFLWRKEMYILAGSCVRRLLEFTAPKILAS